MKGKRFQSPHLKFVFFFLVFTFLLPAIQAKSNDFTTDTTHINSLNQKALSLIENDPNTAQGYVISALEQSYQINFAKGITTSLSLLGNISNVKGDYVSAMKYAQTLLSYQTQANDKRGIAAAYNNIGFIYSNLGNHEKGMDYYLKALLIFKETNYSKGISATLLNIGNFYENQGNHKKALEYYFLSYQEKEKKNDTLGMTKAYTNIGNTYLEMKDYVNALTYFEKALTFSEKIENTTTSAIILADIGIIFRDKKEYKNALIFLSNALKLKQKLIDYKGEGEVLYYIGTVYFLQNDLGNSLRYFSRSLDIAEKAADKNQLLKVYEKLSTLYSAENNFEKAYLYLSKYNNLNKQLGDATQTRKMAQSEALIEIEKNEFSIDLLKKDNELQKYKLSRNNIIIIGLSIFIVFSIGIFFLFFAYYKNRQKLIMVRNIEKEIQKQSLEIEEKERKHFAEELHDGLGPLLSGIKLCVNESASEKLDNIEKEKLQSLTNEMIEEAVITVKNISNNLMPHILGNYGLATAINNFCIKLILKDTKIKFDSNVEKRYSSTIEIIIYRIVCELINNSIKHASATTIDIRLLEASKQLLLIYKDNGKGFDVKEKLSSAKSGLGLKNIINRVHMLHGVCDISSEAGAGCLFEIKINSDQ